MFRRLCQTFEEGSSHIEQRGKSYNKKTEGRRERGRREEEVAAPQPLLWASCTALPGEAAPSTGDPAPCTGDGCAERRSSATCVARPGLCCCCCGEDVKRSGGSHQEDLTPSCAPSGDLCPAADDVISSGPVLYLCAASCTVPRPAARGCSCNCLRAPRLLLLTVRGSSVPIWITRREEEERL